MDKDGNQNQKTSEAEVANAATSTATEPPKGVGTESKVPETVPKSEVDKIVSDAVAKATKEAITTEYNSKWQPKLSELGKEAARAKILQADLDKTKTAIGKLEDEIDNVKLSQAEGNPEVVNVYKAQTDIRKSRRELDDREAGLNHRETDISDKEKSVSKWSLGRLSEQLAKENECDVEHLKDLPDEAVMRQVAQALKGTKPADSSQTPETKPKETTKSPHRETGIGEGTGQLTGRAATRAIIDQAREKHAVS